MTSRDGPVGCQKLRSRLESPMIGLDDDTVSMLASFVIIILVILVVAAVVRAGSRCRFSGELFSESLVGEIRRCHWSIGMYTHPGFLVWRFKRVAKWIGCDKVAKAVVHLARITRR
jgi:hypothetical protein